ncbi:hypothetical protein DL93DRAFT_2077655 [Clavulina sp. PMI_390]|nr:hypothetical protein DL93DRAFT_2077655 [Clavulina sp. PMI_390]
MAAVTSVSEPEATEEQIEEEESAPPPDSAKPIVGTTLDPTDEGITPIGEQNGPDKNTIGPGDTVRIEKDALSPSSSTPSISGPQADELGGGDSLKEDHPVVSLPNSSATNSTSSLDSVLALHSARRMKPLVKKDTQKAAPKGVSIPSQRRFLFYWSQILSGASPRGLWDIPSSSTASKPQKVRLIGVTVRLLEPGTTKQTAVRIISNILSRTKNGKGKIQSASGDLWISLARYDDQLVETLESWEKHTRDPKSMGRRRPGSETMHDPIAADGEQGIAKLFDDGRWDNGKMVRSFARLGSLADSDVFASREGGERIVTHRLHPLTESNWIDLKKKTKQSPKAQAETTENTEVVTDDSISTISDREGQVTAEEIEDAKILLDANREVRAKLYLGSVPMGWFWFVPTFHMKSNEVNPVHLNLPKSAIDFPLGPGSWIVDVDVEMEWAKSDSN